MKKIIFVIVVLVLLLIINSLARSIYDLWQKQDVLTEAQEDLDKEKLRNQKLKASLSYVVTEEFIEEKARNNLFLAKPGEQQVVIPQKEEKTDEKKQQLPNWQQWLELFY